MSLDGFMVQPVARLRGVETEDRYHNTVLDWSDPNRLELHAWFHQSDSVETIGEQRVMIATRTVLRLLADADVRDSDRFEIAGDVYEIDGRPLQARTPRGVHHTVVRLKLVEG